jgi:serine protease inhibitor
MRKHFLIFILFLGLHLQLNAQVVDEIVAVVADKIVLRSEIEVAYEQASREFGVSGDSIRCLVTEQKLIVGLPKFTLEYETNLNSLLSNMGMPTMFSNFADLSKISPPAGKLKVGFVKQNTFVAIDEKGTEAAAVTTIGIELTSAPILPEFVCNRPFAFFISEKQSNTILFAGKIVNL